jgi:hypothetical protein
MGPCFVLRRDNPFRSFDAPGSMVCLRVAGRLGPQALA